MTGMKFFSQKKAHAILVADVDGESAGAAVAHIRTGSAEIVSAFRTALPHEERSPEQARTQLLQALLASAEKAMSAHASSGKALTVRKTYAIVHPPWTHSQTVAREVRFERDTGITPAMIAELAKQAFGEPSTLDTNNLIEASIVRTELNGYPTAEPKGKKARSLRVFVLMSDCDADMRGGIPEVLGRQVPAPALIRSGARSLLGAVRRSSHPQDCLVANVTGSATEFLVVHDGGVVDQTVAPEGVGTIIRAVAGGKLPEEVRALMKMASSDACTTQACEELNHALAGREPELVKVFGETLATLAKTRKLPNALVLSAPEDMSGWLAQFFAKIDFGQFTLTARPFEVELLDAGLKNEISYGAGVAPDSGLYSAVALVNTELAAEA
jgi:hypothetical protein